MMRIQFDKFYRGFLLLLCVTLAWSVWSLAAQELETRGTNSAPASTNTPASVTISATAGTTAVNVSKPTPTPAWIERLAENLPFLKWTLWENELWKYLFSLVYIFLAFYVSKLLDYLTRVWLKKWAEKSSTKFDDLVLDLLNGPVKVVAFMIFLRIGLDVFAWPATMQKILTKGFTVIVAISLTYMVLKFIDLFLNFWRQRAAAKDDEAFNKQLFPIIRKSLKLFVIVVAALVTLDNLGINITAAIASLSIGGLAVGLAAQDTLANLFGAVAVFLDKPFKIGDRIQIENVDGAVESIGLRSTRVRNLNGHLVTIPNKTMGNATIVNIAARERIKTEMNLGLTYDTPVEKVRLALQIIKDVFGNHPMTSELVTSFNRFDNSALNILVVHFWKDSDFAASLAGLQEMNLALKERFDKEGISFAYPTQTLYVKQDPKGRLSASSKKPPIT